MLAGRPGYTVTGGEVLYQGRNLLEMAPEDRAREGVFLAFQYPVEIPGVNNVYLLTDGLQGFRDRCLKPVSLRPEPFTTAAAAPRTPARRRPVISCRDFQPGEAREMTQAKTSPPS